MTNWILIFVIYTYQGVTVNNITFKTEQACVNAKRELKKEIYKEHASSRDYSATCVPDLKVGE